MPTFEITWQQCGITYVDADDKEEAIKKFRRRKIIQILLARRTGKMCPGSPSIRVRTGGSLQNDGVTANRGSWLAEVRSMTERGDGGSPDAG
ncbi:MAG: hypothetical protein ACXVGR_11410 [Mycobacteriaceae bacterium]